ncbi:MAG: SLC13 family permease [Geminicoccaceae bacterium]
MLEGLASSSLFQIGFVLSLVVAVLAGLVREKPKPDVVALLALGALILAGILDASEAFRVFSNPAPITVAAMFVLSAALEATGVIDSAGRLIMRMSERWSPLMAVVLFMGAATLLSAFVNNTAVVVILIPVAIRLAKAIDIAPSKLLIPLSFAAILGGTTTLIGTSTNSIVDGVSQARGLEPFGIFEITGAGVIMALVGCTYMAVVGPALLPERDTLAAILPDRKERRFIARVMVPLGSVLVGKTPREAGLVARNGFSIVDVVRENTSLGGRFSDVRLEAGDRIVLTSPVGEMLALRKAGDLALGGSFRQHAFEPVESSASLIGEGIIGPGSRLVGRRLARLGLGRLYGVYVLAVHRRGANMAGQDQDLRLEVGDTLLLEGPVTGMRRLFDDGLLSSIGETSERAVRRDKAPIAIAAILLVVLLAALDVLPIAALAVVAASLVVALGCLDHRDAYRAIRWDIMMLIFGMLAVGMAMEDTGAAAMIVRAVVSPFGELGPLAALAMIYLLTSMLTETMSNNAAAILLTPIAMSLAGLLGVDPRPFVVAIMFAASASFATPIGYQTNTLVYTAGGYRFTDFLKIGIPLNLLLFLVAIIVIPMFWPFGG